MSLEIGNKQVGVQHPVFFVADIASNHCGDLAIAKELIHACAESGVDAVKMQNFSAGTIVSDYGFRNLEGVKTHQSDWDQSVFDSYDAAAIPLEWTEILKTLCDELGLAYFTSPYSVELVHTVAPFVSAFKLGSGDITWHDEIATMATYDKPILIATGASNMEEVELAMEVALKSTDKVLLMQCNTEYTAGINETQEQRHERFRHINLKVLETFSHRWPGIPLGLSDHTHGADTVLGAVGLYDCCTVEKHFTFDNSKTGQDHSFSETPTSWAEMVAQVKELKQAIADFSPNDYEQRFNVVCERVADPKALQLSIGNGVKKLETNETQTVIVQRRAIRATRDIPKGTVISPDDLIPLRPCPAGALAPYMVDDLVGKTIDRQLPAGSHFLLSDIK